jgi:Ca2+-binding RTX toxin-like protein
MDMGWSVSSKASALGFSAQEPSQDGAPVSIAREGVIRMAIAKVGPEFQVNTTTLGNQMDSQVAVLADGRFVVTYNDFGSGSGRIRARIFNADGSQAVAEFSPTSGLLFGQNDPDVTVLSDGRFVISYTDGHAIGGGVIDRDIRAMIFNADGTTSVASFAVNAGVARDQFDSRVTALSGGRFLVTYSDDVTPSGASDQGIIRGRIFNANGTPATADFQISTFSHGQDKDSHITALADGRFVVTYSDFNQVPASYIGWDIRARVFNADGTPASAEFVANANPLYFQQESDVAALSDGRFIVTYTDDTAFSGGIYARIFNANGTQSVAAFKINTTNGNLRDSNVAVLADGRIAITFVEWGNGTNELKVRIFNADGTSAIPESVVATSTFFILDSTITAKSDGTFVITYTDYTGVTEGTNSAGIRAQIFDPRLFDGTAGADTITGGSLADYINGGAGNDVFFGRAGNDILNGGLGADYLDGGDGFDMASYRDATAGITVALYDSSRNTGEAAYDAYVSIEALQGSSFNDILLGDSTANVIYGGSGDDYIDGVGGADYLYGEAGNDQFNLRAGAEKVDGGADYDYARYDYATAEVVAALFDPSINTGWAAGDTYTAVEGLVGSAYGDALYGDASANSIWGGAGNDYIDGVGGNDNLYGQDGDDSFNLRAGAEAVDGGAGFDFARYDYATAGVTASLLAPAQNTGWAAADSYFNIEGLVGSAYNDSLTGNATTNSIWGGAGNDMLLGSYGADGAADQLTGGDGNDTYIVQEALDAVTETNADQATGGFDLVYAAVNYALGANLEYVYFYGGNALSTATGNTLDNVLSAINNYGGSGMTFTAGDGNDIVYGSYYADTINGGNGADTLWGSWGADGAADAMTGGAGADTYVVQEALDTVIETDANPGTGGLDLVYAGISYTLGANVEYLQIYGSATTGTGNGLDNLIAASYSGVNTQLFGLGGADQLVGGAGNDRLDGGAGGDVLIGSTGNDTFVFVAGQANGDVITDFNGNGAAAGDSLELSGYGAGATFTNIDATHWQVNYGAGLASHDIITFSNSAAINAQDVIFV